VSEREASRPKSFVERQVNAHWLQVGRGDPTLMTVTHTPNGIVTHVVAAETSKVPEVQMEQGRVVTKVDTADYGTVLSVLGGPAVVEVALHTSPEQRDRYAEAVQRVDREAMSHVMVASRTAMLTILQHLGMPAEDPESDDWPDDGPDEEGERPF
jgi:hypothetical protein